ncbi:MAG: hypothetical protein Q7J76_08240 [Candidatus Brocadiaceae bacterium]|uniref:hypothetical protein n=1 Tax=Candidatus Wunengus sp. YC61 TaxID=3367698 RepID=UPI0027215520|nr:hypothetical protein [Candidatus Brocadiaceae bacterium]
MKKFFQTLSKIWNDPVWSKVIAVAIVASVSLIYATVQNKTEGVSFADSFKKILDLKVKIIYIAGAIIIYLIGKRIFKRKDSFYNRKQTKLREFNKLEDKQNFILYRWGVFFDYETPFISDLTPFCTRHDATPIRFVGSSCPIAGCNNNRQQINLHLAKNHIESVLIDEWEKTK